MAITLSDQDDDNINVSAYVLELSDVAAGDSTQSLSFDDINDIQLQGILIDAGKNVQQDDDQDTGTVPQYSIAVGDTPLKALIDSELPAGGGGPSGPSTTQIWKTG
jgi:hypothetical protein